MADAGQQVAQLRHVLGLVEQIAGRDTPSSAGDAALDEGARISSAYWDAAPIVQRRFDTLSSETAAWAATAVEALLAAQGSDAPPRAPAARMADELRTALKELARILKL